MNPVASYFGKMRWGIRCVGPINMAMISAAKMAAFVSSPFTDSEWFWRFAENRFDKRMGVETTVMVPVEKLDVDEQRKKEAIRYEPTPFLEFGYVISRLPIDHARYSFVDFGSGKGRALLMALKFSFRRVLGVEFSRTLHEAAVRNLASYCDRTNERRECRSIHHDATAFELPEGPVVLYLFNPFKAKMLSRVLENVRKSYERSPRHIVITYCNPLHREVLDRADFLKPTRSELNGWWMVYETDNALLTS
jgi:SAM-dependent methyltransferase